MEIVILKWKFENGKLKTEKMKKKVLKFEIQNWFKRISHLADCWWSCRSYNRMYLTMYLKMYLNEVHEVHVSLYLTFHILWYFGYLYFKNFQEFLEFSVISWYVIYACCGLILTLNKLIWLVRIIFKIPHFLPHYLPQWGKWGICFILPHFFIYIAEVVHRKIV